MKINHLLACLLLPVAVSVLAAPYTVSADGQEVTDTKTGLIWRRCAEGMTASGGSCTGIANSFTPEAALRHASTQASTTGVAWRLPNVKELSSIADKSRQRPAIDTVAFPATPSYYFWSSSPYVGGASVGEASNLFGFEAYAWCVDFSAGTVVPLGRGANFHLRLVRAGQ
jgi:Protein of unknown function (DUF1566)